MNPMSTHLVDPADRSGRAPAGPAPLGSAGIGRPRLLLEDPPRHVHLLGAGGAGVSGIGRILASHGVRVTGHDRAPSGMLAALGDDTVSVVLGASRAEDLPAGAELVIRSAAVPEDDPQVVAARARGLSVLKYAEALARLAAPERLLAVAGTHGKTTTSWMLWHALEGIGGALGTPVPGALVGGLCRRMRTNALAGSRGGWFCVEACEYDRTFLQLLPRGAIATNVEEDHLDYYGSRRAIHEAFARFAARVAADGLLVVGREVPEPVELAADATVWRLGRELEVDLYCEERGCFTFRLRGPGWATPEVDLGVPGHFNVDNAALALALSIGLVARVGGYPPEVVALGAVEGIVRFVGAARRFEPWGRVEDIEVVHDYAHHPTEVRVTLETARRAHPGLPLHVLFQPHQHSRTARFLQEFAESLRSADRVVVADVYGARRHIDGERFAGSPELVLGLQQRGVEARFGGPLPQALDALVEGLPDRAVVMILGAGDVELVRDELLQKLALRRPATRRDRP